MTAQTLLPHPESSQRQRPRVYGKHVVILGAGFGGLELSSRFTFGFSKLDILFGGKDSAAVKLLYREIAKPGVEFRQ